MFFLPLPACCERLTLAASVRSVSLALIRPFTHTAGRRVFTQRRHDNNNKSVLMTSFKVEGLALDKQYSEEIRAHSSSRSCLCVFVENHRGQEEENFISENLFIFPPVNLYKHFTIFSSIIHYCKKDVRIVLKINQK